MDIRLLVISVGNVPPERYWVSKLKLPKVGLLILVGVALLALPQAAMADSIVCPPDIGNDPPISDNVSNSTGCEIGSTNNDSVSQVNADTMFGINNWSLYGGGNVNGQSGTIDLSGVNWATIGNLMIVFKGGEGEPDAYVGFLIVNGFTGEISWITPFVNPDNDVAKDVSHINIYVTTDTPEVPEPASMVLLGTGLIGVGRLVRRRLTA